MSKIHINKIGLNSSETYDSISFGEKIFVEEMPKKSIPSDYTRIENSIEKNIKISNRKVEKKINSEGFLKSASTIFAVAAVGFIAYSIFGGILDSSALVMKPLGRELGIAFGIFTAISIIALLVAFSKTKINLFVDNGLLHIKSYRGLNHAIPVESIADCRVNIFGKADSISSFANLKKCQIDLDSGLLVILKNGQNLLIASSNSYQTNKNLAFN